MSLHTKTLHLTIDSQMFYNIRRPVLKNDKELDLEKLNIVLNDISDRWVITKHFGENNEMMCLSFISKRFQNTPKN